VIERYLSLYSIWGNKGSERERQKWAGFPTDDSFFIFIPPSLPPYLFLAAVVAAAVLLPDFLFILNLLDIDEPMSLSLSLSIYLSLSRSLPLYLLRYAGSLGYDATQPL